MRLQQRLRCWIYQNYCTEVSVKGAPFINQPVLFKGKGQIEFGQSVTIGWGDSPAFYSGYGYIEARTKNAKVIIGKNVIINNNISIIANERIEIGDYSLIGFNVEILDSDFHSLEIDIDKRRSGKFQQKNVYLGKNIFVGNNVKILKGVTIGDNSVVANGSIVTNDVPSNVVVAGIPAKVVSQLGFEF